MTTFANQSRAADHEQMLAQLDASLASNPDVDAADRETMLRHFRDALESEPAAVDGAPQAGPDRRQWVETLDLLAQDRLLDEDDRNDMLRQFDDAMGSLQSDAVRTATEFSQRCQRDGEGAAQQWLADRMRADAGTGDPHDEPAGLPAHVAMALRRRR